MPYLRTFRCGTYEFGFVGDPRIVAALRPAFADLSTTKARLHDVWDISRSKRGLSLRINGDLIHSEIPDRQFAARVVSTLTRKVLDHEPHLLHLHVSAVVNQLGALVVAGPSGSGKSTICTGLLAAGASYVSDEIVAVSPASSLISSFPKPISVKKYARGTVERLTGLTGPDGPGAPWMLPAGSFATLAPAEPHDVRTVVSYRHDPTQPTAVEPLHRATAVRELLGDSQDAERHGAASLAITARLTVRANCLRATGSDAADAAATLLKVHEEPFVIGTLVELAPPPAFATGPRRAEHTTSVMLDGRALIYDTRQGRIIELDEHASAWWALLDGTPLDLVALEYAEALDTPATEAHDRANDVLIKLDDLGVIRS